MGGGKVDLTGLFLFTTKGWSEGLKQVFHQLPDADWCA